MTRNEKPSNCKPGINDICGVGALAVHIAVPNNNNGTVSNEPPPPKAEVPVPSPPVIPSSGEVDNTPQSIAARLRAYHVADCDLSIDFDSSSDDEEDYSAHTSTETTTSSGANCVQPSHGVGKVPPPSPVLPSGRLGLDAIQRGLRKIFRRYCALKVFSILLTVYIAMITYTYVGTFGEVGGFVDPTTGLIIDANSAERTARGVILDGGVERSIVADNTLQMLALSISRATAFLMYPCTYGLIFGLVPFTPSSCSHNALHAQRWCSYFSPSSGQLMSSSVTLLFPFIPIKIYMPCTSSVAGLSLLTDSCICWCTQYAGQARET